MAIEQSTEQVQSTGHRADNRKDFDRVKLDHSLEGALSKIQHIPEDIDELTKEIFRSEINNEDLDKDYAKENRNAIYAYSKIEAIAESSKSHFEKELIFQHMCSDFISKYYDSFEYTWGKSEISGKTEFDSRIIPHIVKDYLRATEFLRFQQENPELAVNVLKYGIDVASAYPTDGFEGFKQIQGLEKELSFPSINETLEAQPLADDITHTVDNVENDLSDKSALELLPDNSAIINWDELSEICNGRAQINESNSNSYILFGDTLEIQKYLAECLPSNPSSKQVSELFLNNSISNRFDATTDLQINNEAKDIVLSKLKEATIDLGSYYSNKFAPELADEIKGLFNLSILKGSVPTVAIELDSNNSNLLSYTPIDGVCSHSSAKEEVDLLITEVNNSALSLEHKQGITKLAETILQDTFASCPVKLFSIEAKIENNDYQTNGLQHSSVQAISRMYDLLGDNKNLAAQIIQISTDKPDQLNVNDFNRFDIRRLDDTFTISNRKTGSCDTLNYSYEDNNKVKLELNKLNYTSLANNFEIPDKPETASIAQNNIGLEYAELVVRKETLSSRLTEATTQYDSGIKNLDEQLNVIQNMLLDKVGIRKDDPSNISLLCNGLLQTERLKTKEDLSLALDYFKKTYSLDMHNDKNWGEVVVTPHIEVSTPILEKLRQEISPSIPAISDVNYKTTTNLEKEKDGIINSRELEQRNTIITRVTQKMKL